MNQKPEEANAPQHQPEGPHAELPAQKARPDAGRSRKGEATTDIAPELTAYFGPSKIAAPAFAKVLKVAKVRRFNSADEEAATGLMSETDPDGERLWGLMSLSPIPEAVDRWVWKAAIDRLRAVTGGNFDPLALNPSESFGQVRAALKERIADRGGKNNAKGPDTWLRVAACWLMERRSMEPLQAVEQAVGALFPTRRNAAAFAAKAIRRGRPSDFRVAAAVSALAQETVETAIKERDAERMAASAAQFRLAEAKAEIEVLRGELAATRNERAQTAEALADASFKLEAERQHFGHDLSGTRAEQRALLRHRLAPLLSDAVDALEIEPPAPDIALERIRTVLLLVNEASRD